MSEKAQVSVRPSTPEDDAFVREAIEGAFVAVQVAAHGELIDASALPGFVATVDGERAGVLTYRARGNDWEVIALVATRPGGGVGSALMAAARDAARRAGARRLWLITTNENTDALRFYQRQGFDLVAIHRDAVTRSCQELKPAIPLTDSYGIPIRHELELEIRFD